MTRRPMTKRFACVDCGEPVVRRDCRCPECARIARANRNREYQRHYHESHRPSPTPRPQRDSGLPPYGEIITDGERIQCHVCGRWYGSLVTHIRTHGLDTDLYKAEYDLPRTSSLLGPAAAAKQRARSLARNQGETGRVALKAIANNTGRPKGLGNRLGSRIASSDNTAKRAAK